MIVDRNEHWKYRTEQHFRRIWDCIYAQSCKNTHCYKITKKADMQTIVDRKVTNTKWTDDLKENDAEVHFHFEQNSLLNMRLTAHDRIPARNTLLYDNQQKRQMRLKQTLSSRAAKGRAWSRSKLFWKVIKDGSNRWLWTEMGVEKKEIKLSSQAAKAHIQDCTRPHSQRMFCRIQVQVPCGESLSRCNDSKKKGVRNYTPSKASAKINGG